MLNFMITNHQYRRFSDLPLSKTNPMKFQLLQHTLFQSEAHTPRRRFVLYTSDPSSFLMQTVNLNGPARLPTLYLLLGDSKVCLEITFAKKNSCKFSTSFTPDNTIDIHRVIHIVIHNPGTFFAKGRTRNKSGGNLSENWCLVTTDWERSFLPAGLSSQIYIAPTELVFNLC